VVHALAPAGSQDPRDQQADSIPPAPG